MKSVGYVLASPGIGHVSRYAVETVEGALASLGMQGHATPLRTRTLHRLVKLLYRTGGVRAIRPARDRALVVPMMGLLEWLVFPWSYTTELVPIVFDCLPHEFGRWKQLFTRNRVGLAFFTASVAAEHFRSELPHGRWLWLPEAIDVDQYDAALSWSERHVDLLEFGRRHERFHRRVADGVRSRGLTHRYEEKQGRLVFETKADFIHGLAHAKISVCFPQSETHPERFGCVETLTQRYLESMASGCVLLGRAPHELVTLFSYDPVVPVDWSDPVQQIDSIVRNPAQHEALRARNLATVRRIGSWRHRAQQLSTLLAEHGYVVPPATSWMRA